MEGFNLNGFHFPNNSASSSSTGTTASNNQANDDATMKKIIEAIELLEKLAKSGGFPQEKLQEIKQELKKRYPNINFNTETSNPQKPDNNPNNNNNHSQDTTTTSTLPNMFPNNNTSSAFDFMNQIHQQQQLNNAIFQQAQMVNNKFVELNMRSIGLPWTSYTTTPAAYSYSAPLNPFYGGVTYPSYHNFGSSNYGQMSGGVVDPMKMVLEMMNNQGPAATATNNPFDGTSESAVFGGDASSSTTTALRSDKLNRTGPENEN